MQHLYQHIYRNPQFHELERKRGLLRWTLAIIVLVAAFFYILVTAFAPQIFAAPISSGSAITWGIVVGLFDTVMFVVVIGIYIYRANTEFDQLNEAVLADAQANARRPAD